MSRRRKLDDSPNPKNTPHKTAATEECGSVVEPGRRRLRPARDSWPRGAKEGPPGPVRQREQPPAAALCSKSNPEERYETPKRMLKMDLLSSSFSSPNDPDGQNDIFWDQNSPLTKQLGKGRKKRIYTTDSDEISQIVNRIAPQGGCCIGTLYHFSPYLPKDEKPTTNSMLDVWIGETAIPCTPSVAKGKSRAKIGCTKLKTKNQEEELMKLAKEFDKNMEELDVLEEQNKRNYDFTQMISETEILSNYKDNIWMQSLHNIVPEIDNATKKKPIKGKTKISVANHQNSSQKPFDQTAEAALNAIFDGSTQKCSGRLSQELPEAFWSTNNTTFGKTNALKEEKINTNETLVMEKLPNKTPRSLSSQVDTTIMTKSCVTSCTEEPETSNKYIDAFTTSDFEDEWENLVSNEAFVIQNVDMPELFLSKTAQVTDQKGICTFNSKNDKNMSRVNTSLDASLGDSKVLQDLSSKTYDRELIDAEYRFSPNSNKLSSTGNKMKFENSSNKIVIQDKIQNYTVTSNLTKIKEDIHTKFTHTVHASEKKSALNTGYSNEQKSKCILNQSVKSHVNTDLFGSANLGNKSSVSNPNHTSASKLGSFFDDWNDPSFAHEIIKACHQLDNTWEADDVDDDLLYQACDDIERLTQQQDIRMDTNTSESIREIDNNSKRGAKNMFTVSKQGSNLVQSKHLNPGNISVQTPLTNSLQIDKPMKMEKGEIYGNSPSFLGTTNSTTYSEISNCQINNLRVSCTNTYVPVQVSSSKLVLSGSSSLNVTSAHMSTEIAASKKKLSTKQPCHNTVTDEAQSSLNKTVGIPKFTFTKMKNSRIVSQFNQDYITGSMSDPKITQGVEKKKSVNPILEGAVRQHSLVKLPESLKQSSKEEEEKNRKCSPEEIQRKRQEALVRRMAKARASSGNAAPTSFL
ncbi:ewing's tumor-associated antigen 1 isoform X1 [Sapajus apella]|uniref:Ewing's tumor-associated antigen 1 isoform X1 n=1 Tax=Sapajus apella TaxID=9515 RepID=A0A6J3J0P4_SAPAP|nr:ewing's tumor-associated antigen 1 isoform X1 [Sapajus apella]